MHPALSFFGYASDDDDSAPLGFLGAGPDVTTLPCPGGDMCDCAAIGAKGASLSPSDQTVQGANWNCVCPAGQTIQNGVCAPVAAAGAGVGPSGVAPCPVSWSNAGPPGVPAHCAPGSCFTLCHTTPLGNPILEAARMGALIVCNDSRDPVACYFSKTADPATAAIASGATPSEIQAWRAWSPGKGDARTSDAETGGGKNDSGTGDAGTGGGTKSSTGTVVAVAAVAVVGGIIAWKAWG